MLVGREVELRALEALCAGARLGQSGVLLLTGEAGIGKTALLEYVAEHTHDLRLLRATGTVGEQDLPFAGLAQLLRPLAHEIDRLPAPQADALGVALALRSGAPTERFAIGAATLGLLTLSAEEQPLAVLVDDAHLLDRPSQQAITFAARRLLAEPIVVLAASRTGEPSPFAAGGLPELAVTRLAPDAAAALAQEASVVQLSPRVRAQITSFSGGNPLAIQELSRHPAELEALAPDSVAPIPATMTTLLEKRVAALPSATRTVVLLAAVADGDLPVIARVCDSVGVTVDDLAPAERAGLLRVVLDRVEFAHPLARAASYTAALPDQRRAMHQSVALALPDSAADRRAWHRCEAALGPDPEVASEIEQVGRRASGRGAFAVAATAHERAARLSSDDSDRATRFLAAGEAAWFAGEDHRATGLLVEATLHDSSPRLRARARGAHGLIAARGGLLVQARDMLISAADEAAGVDPAQALLMYADAVDACFYLLDPAGSSTAADRLQAMLARLSPADPADEELRSAMAIGLIAIGMARVFAGESGAEQIRAGVAAFAEDDAQHRLQSAWELLGVLYLRESATGRDLLQRAVDRRRELSAIGTLPHLLFHLARDDATTDRWQRAAAGYGEAITIARELGQTTELGAALAGLAWLSGRQGRAKECRAAAAEALEIGRAHQLEVATVWSRFALAELDLSTGDAAAAASGFADLGKRLDELGVRDVDLSPVPELVEAQLRTGQERLVQEASAYVERARHKGGPWALARAARVRGLLAADEDIDAEFEEALDRHAETPDRYEAARTRLVYGERLRRARRRVDARVQLQTALEEFERLGAQTWADVALAELRATGVNAQRRESGPVIELTPRELQIALLLSEGRTTREAAAALFVSPKTVEYHLRHVYTKLGVGSRAELAERMRESSG